MRFAAHAPLCAFNDARWPSALMPGRKRCAAPQRGEGRQADNFLTNGPLGDLELERSVVRANDRVALVSQLVEVPIVYPDVLREFELPDEARADDKGRYAALNPVVGRALRKGRPIRRASPNYPSPVHIVPGVARVHPPNVRAKRHGIAVRVRLLVGEVVVTLHVGPEFWIVLLGREYERRATAPAAHQLGRNQFLLLGGLSVLPEKIAELPHMLFKSAIGHEAAIPRQNFRQGAVGDDTMLVGVAKNELARFQRLAGSRRRCDAISLDRRL